MRVLLINGSPRKQGNTFGALSEVSKQLEHQGVESEIVWLGNKPLHGCIACGTCKQKANGRCVFDDDACNEVIKKMESCDAVIIGSPVY
jgi:multimeric flavodoxin WrbA